MLALTVLSQTTSKIVLGWTPVPGCAGYAFFADGNRVANTWDASRSQVSFANTSSVYRVDALGMSDSGSYPPVVVPPSPTVWLPPITITSGGTYTGNWESKSAAPAVTVATSDPVRIVNSRTRNLTVNDGHSRLIQCGTNAVDLTIENMVASGGSGRFLEAEGGWKNIEIRNCTIDRTSGIVLIHGAVGGRVLVTRNVHTNIQDNGYLRGWPISNPGNFVQLREVQNPAVVISWNQILNTYNDSWPEDLVSIYKSGNVTVADNFFRHQSTPGNAYNTSSQGTITVDGDGGLPYPHDIRVLRNQIVDCVNGGYVTGTASDVLFEGNRVIQDGKLPDGVTRMGNGYSAMAIMSGATRCHMHGNVLGFVGRDGGRTDWDANLYAPEGRAAEIALNTTLADPITTAMEQAEWTSWLAKLAANGITVGAS